MSTALVPHVNGNGQPVPAAAEYSPEQVATLRNTIARDCNDSELALFIGACRRAALDPFMKQIYAVKIGGKLSIQTSIDGFRLIAERTGRYRGQLGPFWCGDDGKWVDVWLDKKPPTAARVGVIHRDFAEPLWGVARFASYSTGSGLWQRMPEVMVAKCAEALALRKAFPNDLSGLYTSDEMDQAQGGDKPRQSPGKRTLAQIKAEAREIAENTPPPPADAAPAEPPPAAPEGDGPPSVEEVLALVDGIENEHHAKNWRKAHAADVKALTPDEQAQVSSRFYERFPALKPKQKD